MTLLPRQLRLVGPEPKEWSGQKICIIGEAPGSVEIQKLRPFVGPAGTVLEQCLHGAGIIRSECYLTNVFKFRIKKDYRKNILHPDTNEILWHNKKGFTEAAQPYLEELFKELNNIGSNVFVPLGNPALEALTGKKGITKWRGSILSADCRTWIGQYRLAPNNRKVIPSIHPSATLQSGNYLYRYYIVFDFRRVKEECEFPTINYPDQIFLTLLNFSECMAALKEVEERGLYGIRLNFDIEVINQEVSHVSFSTDLHWGVSIPFHIKWSEHEEILLWQKVSDILENPRISKVNQNILFDAWVLAVKNKIYTAGRLDDPMVANHLVYPDFPKGLDFLTSIHTRIPYYKDDGKIWKKEAIFDEETFQRYNAQDSMVSVECMDKLDVELEQNELRKTYEFTLRLYRPLLAMMLKGIKANKSELEKTRDELTRRLNEKELELNEACKQELNPRSYTQCIQYFYTDKGIKPYYDRKTKNPTTDDKAMARLARGTASRPGIPEAKLVQECRSLSKLIDTYLDIDLDADSRLRCSYNPRGTTTGRLSSSQTIFGTGTNMQNLPPEFKQFLEADKGHVLIELDKRHAEWVVVAYAGGDARMIEVVEKDLDPHTRTANLITGVDMTLIDKEDEVAGHETNPDILRELRERHFPILAAMQDEGEFIPRTMSLRQCGKKSNHGLDYDQGYKGFALTYEMMESEAKIVVDRYHQGYPMIRGGYHAGIQYQLGKDRTISNCFGRRRRFLNRWGDTIFRQAYDYLAQSTVADLVNTGIIRIYEDNSDALNRVELLGQVHDSVLIQHPAGRFRAAARAINRCVQHLDIEMEYSGRTFRIATDVKIGKNWRDMKEVPIVEDVDELARRLSEVYLRL